MLKIHDIVTGKVDNLAFGGEGILRQNGLVLFVPFSAPDEKISCKITKLKKKFAEATILDIIEKSESRVVPKCPYFGTCGGCQLQHIGYSMQLKQKRQWVQDAFNRIGKFENIDVSPVIPSPNQYYYRRHVSLSIKKLKDSYAAGYTGIATSFLQVEQCPIFIKSDDTFLEDLQKFVQLFDLEDSDAKVTVLKDEAKYILHFHFKNLPKNIQSLTDKILDKHLNWSGLIFASQRKTLKFGKTENATIIEGLKITYSTDVFMQNNPEQSLNIYRHIVRIGKDSETKDILDLYCGIGISSLLLANNGIKVTGIEYNADAIKMANRNAKINGILSPKFITGSVENKLDVTQIPDFVIINPPREGLDLQVIELLKKRLPERIVYISCMPTTLARDLNLLGKENYTIEECQPYDMFPQTTHIETLVSLKRIT
jgi:23S rRNA (uracil1939-C5)-methyltransferase